MRSALQRQGDLGAEGLERMPDVAEECSSRYTPRSCLNCPRTRSGEDRTELGSDEGPLTRVVAG